MNPNFNMPRQQGVRVTLDQTTAVKCGKCNGQVFLEGVMLRKVSALLSQDSKEGLIPIQAFVCASCHETLEEFLPTELRTPKIKV